MVTREQRKRANGQLTVGDLYKFCKDAIKSGNKDKFICVGNDTEGNGYHGLFFQFTPVTEEEFHRLYFDTNMKLEEIIILG